MKTKKRTALKWPLLLTVAALLTTLSVGFSTWYEVFVSYESQPNGDRAPKMHAYAVNEGSVVGVSLGGMSVFNYSATSFTEAGNPTDTGAITVTYAVDKDVLFAGDATSTTPVFTLSYLHAGSETLFSPTLGSGQSMSVTATVNGENTTLTNTGATLSVTLPLQKDTCPEEIEIVYTFTIPSDGGNFRRVFGRYLWYEKPNEGTGAPETTTFISTVTRAS